MGAGTSKGKIKAHEDESASGPNEADNVAAPASRQSGPSLTSSHVSSVFSEGAALVSKSLTSSTIEENSVESQMIRELATLVDVMDDIIARRRPTIGCADIQKQIDLLRDDIEASLTKQRISTEDQHTLIISLRRNETQWETIKGLKDALSTPKVPAGPGSVLLPAKVEASTAADPPVLSPQVQSHLPEGQPDAEAEGRDPDATRPLSASSRRMISRSLEKHLELDAELGLQEANSLDPISWSAEQAEVAATQNMQLERKVQRKQHLHAMREESEADPQEEEEETQVEEEEEEEKDLAQGLSVEARLTRLLQLEEYTNKSFESFKACEEVIGQGLAHVGGMKASQLVTAALIVRERIMRQQVQRMGVHLRETAAEEEAQRQRAEELEGRALAAERMVEDLRSARVVRVAQDGSMDDAWIAGDAARILQRYLKRKTARLTYLEHLVRVRLAGKAMVGGARGRGVSRPVTKPVHRPQPTSGRTPEFREEVEKLAEESVGGPLRRARVGLPRPLSASLLWDSIDPLITTAAYQGRPVWWRQSDDHARPLSARWAVGPGQAANNRPATAINRPATANNGRTSSSSGPASAKGDGGDALLTRLMRLGMVPLRDAAMSVIQAYARGKVVRLGRLRRGAREKALARCASREEALRLSSPWGLDKSKAMAQGRRPLSASLAASSHRPTSAARARPVSALGRVEERRGASPGRGKRGAKEWARDREAARGVMGRFLRAEDDRGMRHVCASVLQAYLQRKMTRCIYLTQRMRMRKYVQAVSHRREILWSKQESKSDFEMKSALGEPESTSPGYYILSPPDLEGLYSRESRPNPKYFG